MPDDQHPRDDLQQVATGRDALETQLRELEAFVARSDAEGSDVSPVAREMVERLREIVRALEGLSSSLNDE